MLSTVRSIFTVDETETSTELVISDCMELCARSPELMRAMTAEISLTVRNLPTVDFRISLTRFSSISRTSALGRIR